MIDNFFEEAKKIAGMKNALFSEEIRETLNKNVTEYKGNIFGIIYPKNEDILRKIILKSAKYNIPVHPISQGKNWGFGSRLSSEKRIVLIDFSKHMNNILYVNADLGYAVIEPGVTQGQLSKYLLKNNFPYFLDVTGSSECSSIVGNLLDRGVGFNAKREDLALSMRILMTSGDYINTCHLDKDPFILRPPSCEPKTHHLFVQSNFGIVTQVFIRLLKKEDVTKVFNLIPKKNIDFSALYADLSELYKSGYLRCIFHLYDSQRIGNESFPLIGTPEWFGVANIKGSKSFVKYLEKEIKKVLRKHGLVVFYTYKLLRIIKWLFPFMKKIIYLLDSSIKIQQGQASNTPVMELFNTLNPDEKSKKFLNFIVIAFPHTKTNAFISKFNELKLLIKRGFSGVSINLLDDMFVEAVISVEGNRESSTEVKSLHNIVSHFIKELINEGFHPYRIDVNNMKTLKKTSNHILISKIKSALDSRNIISPSRYNI